MSVIPNALRTPEPSPSSGGRLVATDGRALPLSGAALVADARAGLVRVTLEQTFTNPWDEPLHVTYTLPLPADGAVSGFSFRVGDQRVVGEVDTRKQAKQRFEDAVLSGRTAALLDQERSSLFTQQVGNVPPRTQVVCEIVIDQKLAFLPDGAWEWRFPTVVAPRYLGEPGRVADGAKVTVDVADRALPVQLSLSLSVRDRLAEGARPESPSHALHTAKGADRVDVTFADEGGAGLDRDVVVRWKVATLSVGTSLDLARPASGPNADSAYALVTLVPPAPEAGFAAVPRDLIVLLDTSGSMSGAPLDQARRVTSALVDSLGDADQLELIEFSYQPRRWKSGAVKATASNRKAAQAWLAKLRASGGTEMRAGIIEALASLRAGAQRQVVLITDGLIGGEHEVLEAIMQRLPTGSRVHCVGVGSAVNRSLTLPAARAGRGVELIVGLGEDAEAAVRRILARTARPLVTNVEVTGAAVEVCAPTRIPDLFGGTPSLVALKLRPEGGEVLLRGHTADGPFESRFEVAPVRAGAGNGAVTTLFARELVEDLELAVQTGGNKRELDGSIERLGLDYQIATRLTSWVAISDAATVDPRAPRRKETMPQQLPHGLSAEGLGLRGTSMASPLAASPKQAPTGGFGAVMAQSSRADGRARKEKAERTIEPLRRGAAPPADLADDEREGGEGFLDALSEAGAPEPMVEPRAPEEQGVGKDQKGDGFFDKVKKAAERLSGSFGEGGGGRQPDAEGKKMRDATRTPARPAPAPVAGPASAAPPRILSARVVTQQDGSLVLELTVEGAPVDWEPRGDVAVELADGTLLRVKLDPARTTSDGVYGAGLTLTLAITVPSGMATPTRVTLTSAGQPLQLSVVA